MKKVYFSLFGLLSISLINAQQLDWAYSLRHTSVQNYATSIASNGQDFAIIAGVANGISYDFVSGNATYNGSANVVAKYGSDATIQWVIEHPGGGGGNRILHMDASGNVYAIGRFSGTLDFDPSAQTHNETSALGAVYVQKLDANGALVWVGFVTVDGEPVKADLKSNGNIVIAGRSQDPSMAHLSNGDSNLVEKGVFLLEFSPNGDALHAYGIPTPTSFNNNIALTIDNADNVYVGASIAGEMNLDLKTGSIPDTSRSGYDVVLAKYDNDFDYVWHKVFGDNPTASPDGWDVINTLAFADDGYIYAGGWFTWTTDFDPDDNPGTWVKTAATGSQSPDGFLIKYDTSGTIQWIQEAGGHTSIATNADINFFDLVVRNDQVVLFGTINGSADFDGGAGDFILQTQDNGLGLCLAQYNTQGVFVGAWLLDGNLANEAPSGVEPLGDGVVVYGTFQKVLDADLLTGQYFLATDSTGPWYSADNDVFVARYEMSGFTTGLIDLQKNKQVQVYPNPSSGLISVAGIPGNAQVEITDISGKILLSSKMDTLRGDLDLSALPPGVYFLKVTPVEKSETVKIVIAR